MDLALCYESVLPARGGCETYIADLARRLVGDGNTVHLYASRWAADALPSTIVYHPVPLVRGPRFLRPWRFSAACRDALKGGKHDLSIGFNKTWGQDILYPQAGLHIASAEHNLRKHRQPLRRALARLVQSCDFAHRSFLRLERRQYLGEVRPTIVVNSRMVQRHFRKNYGIPSEQIHVVHSAIDPGRFEEDDRPRRRLEWREKWGIGPEETVGLFVAMNYRLKGLDPLLLAVRQLPRNRAFRLLVIGHPNTRAYARLAKQLDISDRVCFAGYCADTRNGYFAADFLIHPTYYDPCSLVALEAMACGLPIITSRFNGASELLNPPSDGFVVKDPNDFHHLAWCMNQLLDPARRSQCTQTARRHAQQWTFEDHYRLLTTIFRDVAARKQAA